MLQNTLTKNCAKFIFLSRTLLWRLTAAIQGSGVTPPPQGECPLQHKFLQATPKWWYLWWWWQHHVTRCDDVTRSRCPVYWLPTSSADDVQWWVISWQSRAMLSTYPRRTGSNWSAAVAAARSTSSLGVSPPRWPPSARRQRQRWRGGAGQPPPGRPRACPRPLGAVDGRPGSPGRRAPWRTPLSPHTAVTPLLRRHRRHHQRPLASRCRSMTSRRQHRKSSICRPMTSPPHRKWRHRASWRCWYSLE